MKIDWTAVGAAAFLFLLCSGFWGVVYIVISEGVRDVVR